MTQPATNLSDDIVRDALKHWNTSIVESGNDFQRMKSTLTAIVPQLIEMATKPVEVASVQALEALKKAEIFIENGVELGFIRLPDQGDAALETLPLIKDAIRALSGEPAQGELLKCIGFMDYFSMIAIKHGADFSQITISKTVSDTHAYPIYTAPTSEAE